MRIIYCLLLFYSLQIVNGDVITGLPGYHGHIPFKQYSGYVTVNENAGRNLFYWLTMHDSPKPDTPVVLWMNGGPGCSSLFGAFTENGPFKMTNGSTLLLNPHRWNSVAHMIYLETPAGVGFSYALNGNYTTGDDAVTMDNFQFVVGFFKALTAFCVLC